MAARKKKKLPDKVVMTIRFESDLLVALDELDEAGIFPANLSRTRAARLRWCALNFKTCYDRLLAAHRLAGRSAEIINDKYLPLVTALAAALGQDDAPSLLGDDFDPAPEPADLYFGSWRSR